MIIKAGIELTKMPNNPTCYQCHFTKTGIEIWVKKIEFKKEKDRLYNYRNFIRLSN